MTTKSNEPDKLTMHCKSVQAGAIRVLAESLKEVLTDVNFHFDKTGIKVMSMDGSKVALVHLRLEASQFEEFSCCEAIQAGVNMISLFKILKVINNSDIVSFYIKDNARHRLFIKIENKDKNSIIESCLKLLDLNEDMLTIPDVAFDSVITMPCVDFQRYCRDLSVISDVVQIQSVGDYFELICEGDFADQTVRIGETRNGLVFTKKKGENVATEAGEIVKGSFSLKYLNLFTKSTNLCSTLEIYLKADYPLILVYSVANLGRLQFGLAPATSTD